jgi:hypothetical protein
VYGLIALTVLGCSSAEPEVEQQPAQQPTPAEIKTVAVPVDPDLIPVQSGALNLPYQQLGVLQYVEPFSPQAIDEDHIDDRLRTMAIQNWGNDVGAIVGVKTSLSSYDHQVTVSAQVVKVTGDCSFCRRPGASGQGQ